MKSISQKFAKLFLENLRNYLQRENGGAGGGPGDLHPGLAAEADRGADHHRRAPPRPAAPPAGSRLQHRIHSGRQTHLR